MTRCDAPDGDSLCRRTDGDSEIHQVEQLKVNIPETLHNVPRGCYSVVDLLRKFAGDEEAVWYIADMLEL